MTAVTGYLMPFLTSTDLCIYMHTYITQRHTCTHYQFINLKEIISAQFTLAVKTADIGTIFFKACMISHYFKSKLSVSKHGIEIFAHVLANYIYFIHSD